MKFKTTSLTVAICVMFAMAILSFAAGCSPEVCCVRGLAGAAVTYILISWAIRVIADIIAGVLTKPNGRSVRVNNVAADSDR